MTARRAFSLRPLALGRNAVLVSLAALSLAAAGCTASADGDLPTADVSPSQTSSAPPESQASITSNIEHRAKNVPVDQTVDLTAHDGTFDEVRVAIGKGKKTLAGKLSADRTTWTSTQSLEPHSRYKVKAVASDSEGLRTKARHVFRTDKLTLDEQTYPSFAPIDGETVGVGMPVIVTFDVPVTDRAEIERHLSVESTPHQVGAWRWISDNEVHWRPKRFWEPGTDVTVNADINSVNAGNGIYGQLDRSATFHVGDSIVSKVHVQHHKMDVFINGKLARTVAVSAGKPGFITRSGTKVMIEKERVKTMDAASIGIPKSSPEYYNLRVEYSMRVTYSGEFLHAAPWSAGSQGIANTSHGCVGMSDENARWLYNMTKRGDVVKVFGSSRHMTLTNGYGDWVLPFQQYKEGSALS